HLDLLSTQWLPLFVLFLIKARNEQGWLNVAAASIFLVAALLTSPYYMLFLLVFTGLVVAALVLTTRPVSRAQILRTVAPVAVFVILASPVLIPTLILGRHEGRAVNPAYDI